MTDDSVIEEAMKAVNVAKEAIWRTSPDFDGETNLIAALDKMLDVFEKAHAPTDDGREALLTELTENRRLLAAKGKPNDRTQ